MLTVATVITLVAFWPSHRLQAIGPTAMIFYGEPLKKQIVISGNDIALFGDLTEPLPQTQTTARAYIAVALFWGTPANPAGNGVAIADLTPAMAQQHGRYYPATASQPASIMMTTTSKMQAQPPPSERQGVAPFVWGGPVRPEALALLKRLGIPTGPGAGR